MRNAKLLEDVPEDTSQAHETPWDISVVMEEALATNHLRVNHNRQDVDDALSSSCFKQLEMNAHVKRMLELSSRGAS